LSPGVQDQSGQLSETIFKLFLSLPWEIWKKVERAWLGASQPESNSNFAPSSCVMLDKLLSISESVHLSI
jgi:hypothetical protein